MYTYQHKNVTLEIHEDINIGEDIGAVEDSLGWCHYEYPKNVFKKFFKSDEGEVCKKQDIDPESNADGFISFLDYYTSNNFEPITIVCTAQHRYWIYHDLCHSIGRDVIGCEGHVNAYLERMRMIEGLEFMIAESGEEMDYDYKRIICEAFFRRFKENIDIPFFFDWKDEMYGEYEEEEEY